MSKPIIRDVEYRDGVGLVYTGPSSFLKASFGPDVQHAIRMPRDPRELLCRQRTCCAYCHALGLRYGDGQYQVVTAMLADGLNLNSAKDNNVWLKRTRRAMKLHLRKWHPALLGEAR